MYVYPSSVLEASLTEALDLRVDRLIVGQAPVMAQLKSMISMVAARDVPVLVQGETGAGKELVAQALHAASGRKGKLVAVNCAAIPSELLESELFGYEKGAFTGADQRRVGLVELAERGTLFLDEIGDMSLDLQAKLLRVLESRSVQRLGGSTAVPVDFRLVTATHKGLETQVEKGQFRADLFYRINVFPLEVPRLADRREDIPLILEHMLEQALQKDADADVPHFSAPALHKMMGHDWPGNVRELRNVLDRAKVLFPGRMLSAGDVDSILLSFGRPAAPVVAPAAAPAPEALPELADFKGAIGPDDVLDLKDYLTGIEKTLIADTMTAQGDNVSRAAKALGLQRTTLIEKLKKLKLR